VGCWHGILSRYGIDVGDGRHKSCPLCGGKDRFRFDDKDGRGTWICNQCGASDGLGLLMKKLGIEFIEACEEVGKVIGTVKENPISPEKKASPEKLRELFLSSTPIKAGDPVTKYLINRGLSDFPPTLRYAPKCWEYETKKEQNAMLAVFSLAEGEAVTIHRTFIKDGKKLDIEAPRKVMTPIKKMAGGAVRLYPEDGEVLGVAEGIETAIGCKEYFKIPTWAALSASLLEGFKPPIGIKEVIIFSDNDENYCGQKASYTLANRLFTERMKVEVHIPIKVGDDWLDEIVRKNKS